MNAQVPKYWHRHPVCMAALPRFCRCGAARLAACRAVRAPSPAVLASACFLFSL